MRRNWNKVNKTESGWQHGGTLDRAAVGGVSEEMTCLGWYSRDEKKIRHTKIQRRLIQVERTVSAKDLGWGLAWWVQRVNRGRVTGEEVGKVGMGKTVRCLSCYGKKFRFYSKLNRTPLESLRWGFKIYSKGSLSGLSWW